MFSMHLASWLMLLELGGSVVLPMCVVWRRLGRREGSMRVPDGPGEASAGRPGGREILVFHMVL